jgi:predicted amidohydrolase
MGELTVGIVQTCTGIDPSENARSVEAAVEALASEGAEIVFTPEMSGLLDRDPERVRRNATTEAGEPLLAAVRSAAARLGIWVNIGSLAIRAEDSDDLLINRGFLIDSEGSIRARYDKLHMFDVTLGGGEQYRESATYRPGSNAVLASTPWGKVGLTICYDVRFPALYSRLALGGASIIAVPAAFTVPTGIAHWHTLLRARAIETGSFVVAAAQSGGHADGRSTFGHSLVVDPWGEILLDLGDGPRTATCRIDLERVRIARTRVPSLLHRRDFVVEEL